ncbi:MAG: PqqD family protein [Oscillospiraceae bacterium]|nr:PqqD family protein [Oscillospiraceae bacterium]
MDFDGLVTLNGTGGLIWRMLSDGGSDADVINAVMAEYDVTRDAAESDLREFLLKLKGAGFLVSE